MQAEYAHIVRQFLSAVTQEHNPSLIWKAEKYSTGKFYKYHGYGTLDEAMDWIIEKNETYKDEIFFSVHSRKRVPKPVKGRKWEKQPARSLFVDIDCGNGKSFSTKEEGFSWAKHTWERLDIEPSFLVDSRSGYHLYWVFPEGITPKRWKEAQLHLAKEFRGDLKVCCPSQVMRLPGSLHYKDHWEGYFVNLKESGNRFAQDSFFQKVGLLTDIEFQMYLFGVSDVVEKVKGKKLDPVEAVSPFPSIAPSKPKGKPSGRMRFTIPSDKYKAIEAVLEEARQDRGVLEGYTGGTSTAGNFKCPYHLDKVPSACIFLGVNGNYLFRCNSGKCSEGGKAFTKDIVALVGNKEKKRKFELVNRVLELMGREDLLIPDRTAILNRSNLDVLKRNGDVDIFQFILTSNYTTKFKWLPKFLNSLLRIANKKIKNADNKFPASIGEIAKEIDQHHPQAANKLYLCRLAGFIEISEIPDNCRESQEEFKKTRKVTNDTSWHLIPEWTEELIKSAMDTLGKAYDAKINSKSCTRKQIRNAFGPEAEQRVFTGRTTLWRGYTSTPEEIDAMASLAALMTDAQVDEAFGNIGDAYAFEDPVQGESLATIQADAEVGAAISKSARLPIKELAGLPTGVSRIGAYAL